MNSRIQNIDKEASTLFTKVVATARQQNSARTNLVRHVAIIQLSIRCPILGDPGADSGGEGKSKQAEKYGTKEKQRTARRAPGDNVLPDQFQTVAAVLASDWCQKNTKFSGTNQEPEQRPPFGTGLVRHCPQGLFWPFFTFLLCHIFPPV